MAAKSLEEIRREHSLRPIQGADPAEIEARFPKQGELEASVPTCEVEGCQRPVFRWQKRCKVHHLAWCKQREAEAERLNEEYFKRRSKKDWPEQEAKDRILSQTVCANCGDFPIPFEKRTVQLKPEGRRPEQPQMLDRLHEMVCLDCAK